ncbi:hypothetical protein GCM10020331_046780 [Ectobacillus funiculus]
MLKTYNMQFKDVKAIDGGLRYTALQNQESDVIDAFSTDGLLEAFHLKVLKRRQRLLPSLLCCTNCEAGYLKEIS